MSWRTYTIVCKYLSSVRGHSSVIPACNLNFIYLPISPLLSSTTHNITNHHTVTPPLLRPPITIIPPLTTSPLDPTFASHRSLYPTHLLPSGKTNHAARFPHSIPIPRHLFGGCHAPLARTHFNLRPPHPLSLPTRTREDRARRQAARHRRAREVARAGWGPELNPKISLVVRGIFTSRGVF